ncbi:Protein of unknown function (DUF3022) [Burkholderia sp. Ch1-1]|uniref:DUF3022 domain-containing protein n=1 Tax=Paraburkholderia dioscoreae TaxID=2604047 RepID=A0A5Q4ZLW0_9BURK|nr:MULTISPECIES: DUF3022 domain-containing protein [Paraburkholderia]EIF31008.1 Protein of unknown function (DUF3022) [Burkholderia sp. Ch1-1]MDR8401533.1 DUF3022 domain-containing protein [Paraburkholderia sp. USG1]VVD28814.1 conserved protein of unknown function [Paraburkholderia dioscoreae]
MEAYQYDCANPEFEELARVISDLFPEQTQFIQRAVQEGAPMLAIHWVAMRFGAAARRTVMTVAIAPAALARYRAMPARVRGRSFAVLRAYVEASLGSLEEQYANGEAVPREITIELGDEFA